MAKGGPGQSNKSGLAAGVLLAGAVGLLALPSAVLALTARFDAQPAPAVSGEPISASEPAALGRPIPMRSLAKGQRFPFTPAGNPNRPDRSVTVAVRVDPGAVEAISVIRPKGSAPEAEGGQLRIAPTAFSLGVSRGYEKFGQNLVQPSRKSAGESPDLQGFSIAPGKTAGDSRFSPRIVVDETLSAGRAPRTFAGDSDDLVDVGGSYRVTKNLDVTAGVRYSQERERLLPPLTNGDQDNQAVYVGTQFRF